MAEINVGGATAAANGHHAVTVNIEDQTHPASCFPTVPFLQKLLAEVLGTYFVIFAGCAAVVVNTDKDKIVSLPGISIVWGLVVMVMVYSVGHISGAHFNPAVTIAFASCNRFPLKQ
nr:aquaporin NIP1-1-like [Tanacetum cinerariifolium]